MKIAFILAIFSTYFFYKVLPGNLFPLHLSKTEIAKLKSGDSLTYYQCHVDSASSELTFSNGQKLKTSKKRITVTEKFVVSRKDSVYMLKYYVSGYNSYPNKKFPYLKLKETDTWYFDLKHTSVLNPEKLHLIAALETQTHPIVHMELNVNKSCPNELIIIGNRINEQLVIEGNYLLSKSLGF